MEKLNKVVRNKIENGLNLLLDVAHANAKLKGFHQLSKTTDQFIPMTVANMHGEISELHEAWRKGQLGQPCDKADKMAGMGLRPLSCAEEELADIIIRAVDTAARLGIDIGAAVTAKHLYNTTRPMLHGGKKS